MPTNTFFEHQLPESKAKTDIVTTFFPSWLNIIASFDKTCPLAYMELFAGQGIYDDGAKSTPIIVIEQILASPHAHRFHVVLNEMDSEKADKLEAAVSALPVHLLAEPPVFKRKEIDSQNVVTMLPYLPKSPAVLFADPFGYRGITRELFIRYMQGSWGRDAIFFFNFKRVNAALSNPEFVDNMEAMFGRERARSLREELKGLVPGKRKPRVHEAMEQSLREAGIRFVRRYEFELREDSLFFISQHEKGLRTMKQVMATRSTRDAEGVPLSRTLGRTLKWNPRLVSSVSWRRRRR